VPRRSSTEVVTAILGGGQGSRLWPLTAHRAKPAVPLAGKFRLIDVPISNSLHAGFDRIFVLTQFNTASLHRHIAQTYRFDTFSSGFVNILAAEQSMDNTDWYQGTADAVRQNIQRLLYLDPKDILILSGDQLYLMDLGSFLRCHREHEADVTIAVQPVRREEAGAFGIMRLDTDGRITEFVEKPQEPELLDHLTPSPAALDRLGLHAPEGSVLASMGMYTFKAEVLAQSLDGDTKDFGREVIPRLISERRVYAFPYDGYWEDIGTIPAFHRANLELTQPVPPLNLYDPDRIIYTHPRFLPGTKVNRCEVEQAILGEGSILSGASVRRCIVGIRAIAREGTTLEDTVFMGASSYEHAHPEDGPLLGLGQNCTVRNAILDLDCRIGDGCQLVNEAGVQDADGPNWAIRGGVIVVPRGAVLPPGTVV